MWSPEMMLTFLDVLEEQDNLGKRSDCGWKPEAWNECRDAVQKSSQSIPRRKVALSQAITPLTSSKINPISN